MTSQFEKSIKATVDLADEFYPENAQKRLGKKIIIYMILPSLFFRLGQLLKVLMQHYHTLVSSPTN